MGIFCAPMRFLILGAAFFTNAMMVHAEALGVWVKAGRTLDDIATIYLGKMFSKKKGTFKSLPESMLETGRKITGDFLVGTYRYAYDTPISDGKLKYDELISVELLDCARSYFGTLKQTRLLNGRAVAESGTADADLLMVQTLSPSTDRQLCDLSRTAPAQPKKP